MRSTSQDGRSFGGLLRVSHTGGLVRVQHILGDKSTDLEQWVGSILIGFMRRHVCIGARSLAGKAEEGRSGQGDASIKVGNATYMGVYPDMDTVASALMFFDDYERYLDITRTEDEVLKTFVAVFPLTEIVSQDDFARKYWDFAQLLVNISGQTHPWDPDASTVPTDKNFELSLGGSAVFTTTLNHHSPRLARKFLYPAWVMNQTSQFEALRRRNDFVRWQDNIRARDAGLDPSGTANPILQDHGYGSAAEQLPGSSVSPCPLIVPTEIDQIKSAGRELLARARKEMTDATLIADLSRRVG